VAEAIDSPPRIEALLADVLAIPRRGLVTLERARLLAASVVPPASATGSGTADGAIKLTLYLGRKARIGEEPAFVAVTRALHDAGADGAIVLLGVDGTRDGQRQRASFFGRNAEVPLAVTAVGTPVRIATALRALGPVAGAIGTVERVELCKRDGVLIAPPGIVPEHDADGRALWQKLTVYTSEDARYHGRPLHQAMIGRLRASDARGATSLRGIWGFHGARAPHGDRLFSLRRRVPLMTVVIDAPERIATAFEAIDRLTGGEGVVTCERVPAAGGAGVQRDDLRLGRFGA
jgi:PII-like signaling protein